MQNYFLVSPALRSAAAALCAALLLTACDDAGSGGGGLLPASPSRSAYTLQFPAIPQTWEALLGAPEWRIEWLNGEGKKQTRLVQYGKKPEINPPETWTSPVTAWPYWPKRDIGIGVFRPAGAIVPFDVSGETIRLSWRGGVDAVLYGELGLAAGGDPRDDVPSRATVPRLPQNFNWPRFRELFVEGSGINEDVRVDPWLADWQAIAAKIAQSGFDKRRLVPAARKQLSVAVGPGPWIGSSPFAEPLLVEQPPLFPVREMATDTWVSAEGLLRCNKETWILLPWE
jgi:hypothetical protein